MKRLPPWRSPWKMPCIMAPSRNPIMPLRTTASVSMPAARMPSTSEKLKPLSRSITSIRRVTSVGWGRGTTKSRWPSWAKVEAMSSMFSASSRKSSSSTMVSAKSSTSAGGLANAAMGMRPTRCGASHAMTARSWWTRRVTEGRCTFITTSVPSSSSRPMDLGDGRGGQGIDGRWRRTPRASGRPSSSSRSPARRRARVRADTWSRHHLNSATSSGGKIPSPEATIWPSLM